MNEKELLRAESLTVTFGRGKDRATAVDRLSFSIHEGQILGLAGQTGCGKTVTALSIMRLLPPAAQVSGRVIFGGRDLLAMPEKRCSFRGGSIAMVFQNPATALNPVMTIGAQITEVLRLHRGLFGAKAREECVSLLSRVGISEPRQAARAYPGSLSGGQRQRALIAMALAGEPKLLIADEPTTALDTTVQAQILLLLRDIQRRTGMSILLITHDLGVIAGLCDSVMIMYAGQLVECGELRRVFHRPLHPYTQTLMGTYIRQSGGALSAPAGPEEAGRAADACCRYLACCRYASQGCRQEIPLTTLPDGGGKERQVRCAPRRIGELWNGGGLQ